MTKKKKVQNNDNLQVNADTCIYMMKRSFSYCNFPNAFKRFSSRVQTFNTEITIITTPNWHEMKRGYKSDS